LLSAWATLGKVRPAAAPAPAASTARRLNNMAIRTPLSDFRIRMVAGDEAEPGRTEISRAPVAVAVAGHLRRDQYPCGYLVLQAVRPTVPEAVRGYKGQDQRGSDDDHRPQVNTLRAHSFH
jgi:hypothetical protein